jgi:hypothetical protein
MTVAPKVCPDLEQIPSSAVHAIESATFVAGKIARISLWSQKP